MRLPAMRQISAARLAAGLALAAALVSAPASSQESAPPPVDYDAWEQVAVRAEEIVSEGDASNDALEVLRGNLAGWRERFLDAQEINAERIETTREQISALGPPPEEGGREPPEIASRRSELNALLSELLAPRVRAEEAFARAEGLIREIDNVIGERQASALLSLGPSPLNPSNWVVAYQYLRRTASETVREVREAWNSDARRAAFRQELPRTLLLLAFALALVARSHAALSRSTERIREFVANRVAGRGRGASGWVGRFVAVRDAGEDHAMGEFLLSLGRVIIPTLGLVLFSRALQSTGLLGARGELLAGELPALGVAIFGSLWLGRRLFPLPDGPPPPIPMPPEALLRARAACIGLGAAFGLGALALLIADHEQYDARAQAVARYPFALAAALFLARLGQLLRRAAMATANEEGEIGFRQRIQALVGRAAALLGIAGAMLGGIGYSNAGEQLVYPAAQSLGLLGLLLIANALIEKVYAIATRTTMEKARDALVPTLLTFAAIVVSLPAFALIWGVREATLLGFWTRLREGISIGETHVSAQNLLGFLLAFGIGYLLTRAVQGALKTSILPKTRLDAGGRNAAVSGVGYVGIFLSAVIATAAAGIDLSSLAIVAGALSLGVGFGLQNIVQNFVSGIILLIERPIAEGDWIEVGPHMGIVESISVRSTVIETFDRTRVIVPNGDFISGSVTNWTRGNTFGRAMVAVSVAYGSDTRRVSEILMDIARNHPQVTRYPEPEVDFTGFGADGLDFRIRATLSDVNYILDVKTEMHHQIAERFAQEGIEIPFAQRDIWLRNPEALRPPPHAAATGSGPPPKPAAGSARRKRRGDENAEPVEASDDGPSDGDNGEAPDQ